MNIKEELRKLEKLIYGTLKVYDLEQYSEDANDKESVLLSDKIEMFINWYKEKTIKGKYFDIDTCYYPKQLRDFIEKIAVWYELRYPNYKVSELMNWNDSNKKDIDKIMFQDNPCIDKLVDENFDFSLLKWDVFYNANVFFKSLSNEERRFLIKAKYNDMVSLIVSDLGWINLYLTPKGNIERISNIFLINEINGKHFAEKELVGKNIKDVLQILIDKYNCSDVQLKEIKKEIKAYEEQIYFKEELLNCVMYRIIERGVDGIGAGRAFIFAKEFNRDIKIPIIYGCNYFSIDWLSSYLKSGGSENLVCFKNYYKYAAGISDNLETITVRERLNNIVDLEQSQKSQVRQLRMERKLEESKRKNNS